MKKYPLYRHRIKTIEKLVVFCDALYEKIFPAEVWTKAHFKYIFGYEANLINPGTFNEKILWLNANDRTKLQTKCADKFLVREYVSEKIGVKHLIPLVFTTKNVSEISKINLPEKPVIVKTNHDSGSYHIIKNKDKIDFKEVQKKLTKSLKFNYYYSQRERQYKDIEPLIIVEELLLKKNGTLPSNYKLFCFNGAVKYLSLDNEIESEKYVNFYNLNWELQDLRCSYKIGKGSYPPDGLNEMISIAEKLAKPFDFVRVDLYELEGVIYFGEMTFTPVAGFGKYKPSKWDTILGNELNLTHLK